MISDEELEKELKKAKLIYISDKRPGIMRQKIGRGFKFYDSEGQRVTSQRTLSRIEHLVVPPSWENVWICPSAKGYLQATGYDEKGRKQYLYHQAWNQLCQQNKFDKLVFFAQVLPKIRQQVRKDMRLKTLGQKKVIATVVWLLEHTLIRVGNDEYAKENNSFGLTTLRNKHVNVRGDRVKFQFVGKSGVEHKVDIDNPQVAKIIKECIELPGYELFCFLDDSGRKRTINSEDVNSYLKEITGEEITAKDFRTWGATLLSAVTLQKLGQPQDKKELAKDLLQAIRVVAKHLGNTTSVCRSYYIHPAIYESYQNQSLNQVFKRNGYRVPKGLSLNEYRVLSLLQS